MNVCLGCFPAYVTTYESIQEVMVISRPDTFFCLPLNLFPCLGIITVVGSFCIQDVLYATGVPTAE